MIPLRTILLMEFWKRNIPLPSVFMEAEITTKNRHKLQCSFISLQELSGSFPPRVHIASILCNVLRDFVQSTSAIACWRFLGNNSSCNHPWIMAQIPPLSITYNGERKPINFFIDVLNNFKYILFSLTPFPLGFPNSLSHW